MYIDSSCHHRPTPAAIRNNRFKSIRDVQSLATNVRSGEDPMRAIGGQGSGILGLLNDLKEKADVSILGMALSE